MSLPTWIDSTVSWSADDQEKFEAMLAKKSEFERAKKVAVNEILKGWGSHNLSKETLNRFGDYLTERAEVIRDALKPFDLRGD